MKPISCVLSDPEGFLWRFARTRRWRKTDLGGLWYGLFPATAGLGLLAATTGGVFLGGALLAALSGIVTDPLQRRLGLHRRRLLRLLRALEGILSGETGENFTMHDYYVARLADIFDMLALALRVSRP
jgi:hypothetical protein